LISHLRASFVTGTPWFSARLPLQEAIAAQVALRLANLRLPTDLRACPGALAPFQDNRQLLRTIHAGKCQPLRGSTTKCNERSVLHCRRQSAAEHHFGRRQNKICSIRSVRDKYGISSRKKPTKTARHRRAERSIALRNQYRPAMRLTMSKLGRETGREQLHV